MASTEVIRELVNVVGLEVDSQSAAKAGAVMKEWEARAQHLGTVLTATVERMTELLNTSDRFSKIANRLAPALEKSGAALEKFGNATTAAATHMSAATIKAHNLQEEVSTIGRETWAAAKKTHALGIGLQDLAKGVMDAQRAEKAAAQATRAATVERVASNTATDDGIGLLARFGMAMTGVREIMSLVGETAHFLVGGLVDSSREIENSARVSGVTTRFFQQMAYAASTIRFEVDDLRDVFLDLSDKVVNGGEDQLKAFRKLGVQLRENGKFRSTQDILLDVADGFAKMEDGTQKTALASTLLGETGARLLPVLNKGRAGLEAFAREADELGVVMDEKTLKAAAEFDAELGRLNASGRAVRNTLGMALLPALTKMVRAFLDLSKRLAPVLKAQSEKWANRLAKAVDFATKGVDKLRLALTLAAGMLLGKFLLAISTVTAAQVAWGSAALIAGARAALAASMPIAPWLLVGAAIAIAIDELYGFATGSDSALGSFIKWLEKIDPEDNNLVAMLKRAGALVFDVTDPKKWKDLASSFELFQVSMLKELVILLDRALKLITGIPNAISRFAGSFSADAMPAARTSNADADRFAREADRAATRVRYNAAPKSALAGFFAGSYQTADEAAIERQRLYGNRDWVKRYGLDAGSLPTGPTAGAAYFGRGASAETAAPTLSRAPASPGVFAPQTNISMSVQGLPGQSPEAIGTAAVSAAYDKADESKRAAYALFTEQ